MMVRLMITGILAVVITAIGAPITHLPAGGAPIWSQSATEVHNAFPLDDGERVLLVFFERRVEDALPYIFYQIINENMEVEFEHPVQLSSEASKPHRGNSVADAQGNIFVGWMAKVSFDPETIGLYATKFSRDGEMLWGGEDHLIEYLPIAEWDRDIPSLIPDERGGVVYCNNSRFLAISEEGSLREDWGWSEEKPDPDFTIVTNSVLSSQRSVYPDGLGGMWYDCSSRDIRGVWNHLDVEGNKLWDEPQLFLGGGMPEYSQYAYPIFICAFNGNAFFTQRRDGNQYLYRVPVNGNQINENDVRFGPSLLYLSTFSPLQNGQIAFSWKVNSGDFKDLGIGLFNPANFSLPWGENGVTLYNGPRLDDPYGGISEQLENGDIITSLRYDDYSVFYRITLGGRFVWRAQGMIYAFSPWRFIAAPDNGFWAYGTSTYYSNSKNNRHRLIKCDQNAELLSDGFIDTGIKMRDEPQKGWMRIDEEGNYRYYFQQPAEGVRMVTMNGEGNMDDHYGTLTYNNVRHPQSVMSSLRMGQANIYFTTRQSCFAVNDDGELLWSQSYQIPEFDKSVNLFTLFAGPDGEHFYILACQHTDFGIRQERGIAVKVRLADGEKIWTSTATIADRTPAYYGMNAVVLGNDAIYFVLDERNYEGGIYALNFEGELIDVPYFFDRDLARLTIFGTASAPDGGIWIGFIDRSEDGLDCYLQKYDLENGLTRRIYPYAEPWTGDYTWDKNKLPFKLISSGGNLWILPMQSIGRGLQCINQEGRRSLGDYGFLPQTLQFEREESKVKCEPDGESGLWMAIRTPEDVIRAFHFNEFGNLSAEWDENGEFIEGNGRLPILFELHALPERNLGIITYTLRAENDDILSPGPGVYNLHHISEYDPTGAPRVEQPTPVDFRLNSVFPQPFNSRLTIDYQMPQNARSVISVHDLNGRLVNMQKFVTSSAGSQRYQLNSDTWRSGVYFITITCNDQSITTKAVLLK